MKGTYVLLVKLEKNSRIKIGKLGFMNFQKGFYAYVGSGMNSLEKRIERHLLRKKKEHWHIDYLLGKARVYRAVYAESGKRKECEIAGKLAGKFKGVRRFGSSDCACESHLFFSAKNFERDVLKTFREAGLSPRTWD